MAFHRLAGAFHFVCSAGVPCGGLFTRELSVLCGLRDGHSAAGAPRLPESVRVVRVVLIPRPARDSAVVGIVVELLALAERPRVLQLFQL